MNRSYLRYLAAVLVLAALALPLAAGVVHASWPLAVGGEGIVVTKIVGVGGQVSFFFNMTGTTWRGPTTYIFLSANGNDFLTEGDTVLTSPFSTVNVQYVTGNVTISPADAERFIDNLYTNESFAGATNATTVYNHLKQYGWALVYLKIATSLPSKVYTPPAIAAGPFNLTLRPVLTMTPSHHYWAYYNCTLNSESPMHSVSKGTITFSFSIPGMATHASSNSFEIMAYAMTPSLEQLSILTLFATYNDTIASPSYTVSSTTNSITYSGELNPSFVPPVLQNFVYGGRVFSGFNASAWIFDIWNSTGTSTAYNFFVVPAPTTGQYTVLFTGGKTPITGLTGSVAVPNLTYSLTNIGLNFVTNISLTGFVNGWLDVLPSFDFTNFAEGVAGPNWQLNPDD
ncbi:MAG: hypothetical protein ACP5HK_05735, partial [Acidilobus sp.]